MQEFNIEKLQLLETEKAKVRKEFERRESTIEVKKKM
jgi:V-type H+-transporting ATPase subunit E